jgi:CRP-like cAMP-binding protein
MSGEAKDRVAAVFLAVSEEIDLEDGEELMHEGYLAFDSGYVLAEGSVEVVKGGKSFLELSAPALLGEMSQFKSYDTRMATVRAKGEALALEFQWEEFHARAKADLPPADHALLIDAIQMLVWERFGCQALLELPLFKGLDDALRLKVCIVLPWITAREQFADGEEIFKMEGRCQSKGHLLMSGTVKLSKGPAKEMLVTAPNLVGVMMKNDPNLRWTATATAQGDVEMLTFSWQAFTKKLEQRLTREEQQMLIESIRQNANAHFWH